MAGHPSGNPRLNRQHIDIQRQGDKELAGNPPEREGDEPALPPGRGEPDKEEGVGTTQRPQR